MSSSSILMNLPAAAPAAPSALVAQAASGAEHALSGTGGFDQALAAVQLGAGGGSPAPGAAPASLAMIAALMAGSELTAGQAPAGATAAAADDPPEADSIDAPDPGAAAILVQMLLGSTAAVPDAPTDVTDAPPGVVAAEPDARGVVAARDGASIRGADTGRAEFVPADDAALENPETLTASAVQEIAGETTAVGNPPPAASATPGSTSQVVVQAAAAALRETTPAAPFNAPAPAHAHALREPVGTARWADELGNRLVLMSVRGQQQGSLTLTPEHLGPVEVQISVSKDTANVWFGAAHADTRVALSEAMPRLRELLAASGLSLGQSGVSEQAPREAFAPPMPQSGGGGSRADSPVAGEATTPAWRTWRPGLLDTYA